MSRENVENLRAVLETWGREPWTPESWQRGAPFDMALLDPHVTYEDETLPDHIGEAYTAIARYCAGDVAEGRRGPAGRCGRLQPQGAGGTTQNPTERMENS